MSGWEIFTWINVGILGFGALLVFAAFLRGLPELLARQRHEGEPRPDFDHGDDG